MIRVCPTCGAENVPTAVHCRDCGRKLPEPGSVPNGHPRGSRRRSFLRAAFGGLILLAIGAVGFWASANLDWQNVRDGSAGFYGGGRLLWSNTTNAVQRWYAKWLSAEPPPPPPATSAPPATANETKIRCWRCGGLGYAVRTEQKAIVDLENRSRTIRETTRVPCPLCAQNGGRTIILPSGAELCPACQGLGRVMGGLSGREVTLNCQICLGRGYLVRKY
ncbi:MAG: hypothetical protein HYV36_08205 [Lentisphaerae bacterium]|nr:hypothetical protein [Lentisphaerota bacterium]